MVQRRVARFVKGRYGMYESVTQMLEELTWAPLSKRHENACLMLFYKIINNLVMMPHSCLEKADGHTLELGIAARIVLVLTRVTLRLSCRTAEHGARVIK